MSGQLGASTRKGTRTLIGGRIIFNNKCSTFDCVVRQLSDTGAALELGSTFAVPNAFVLETKPFSARYDCRVTRRTRTSIEVDFVLAAQAAS